MAGSKWNLLLDRLLAQKLTVAEHRLALALARLLLGWNRDGTHLGEAMIRKAAGLDGRTFDRARQGLIEKGLLDYIPGRGGRGNRGHYQLVLETPAVEREIEGLETPAVDRAISPERKPPLSGTKTPALQRGRKGRGKGKNSPKGSGTTTPTLHQRAFDTYLAAGGSLELNRERGSLAASVKAAAATDATEEEILAAVRDLARTGDFPGYLKQRLAELREQGGACAWPGLDRSQLTTAQLKECGCTRCKEWAEARDGPEKGLVTRAAVIKTREAAAEASADPAGDGAQAAGEDRPVLERAPSPTDCPPPGEGARVGLEDGAVVPPPAARPVGLSGGILGGILKASQERDRRRSSSPRT